MLRWGTGGTIMMPRPGTIVSRPWDAPEMDALTALGKRHGIGIETVLEFSAKLHAMSI
jgi:hypothetical protein